MQNFSPLASKLREEFEVMDADDIFSLLIHFTCARNLLTRGEK